MRSCKAIWVEALQEANLASAVIRWLGVAATKAQPPQVSKVNAAYDIGDTKILIEFTIGSIPFVS